MEICVSHGLEQENRIFLFVHQGTELSHREVSVESVGPAIVLAVAMVTVKVSEREGEQVRRHGA